MFNTTTVKARLIFILALLCAIAVILSALGLRALGATNEALRTVYEDRVVALGQLNDMLALTQQNHVAVSEAALKDPGTYVQYAAEVKQRMAVVTATAKAYMSTYLTPEEKVLAGRFNEARGRFVQEGLVPAVAALESGDADKLRALVGGSMGALAAPVRATVTELVQLQLNVAKSEYLASQARYSQSRTLSITLSVLGIVMGIVVGYWIIRNILQSLANALDIAESVAQGDLTRNVSTEADNEVGRLVNSLQRMQYNLVGIVGGVRGGTEAIATAASQIAAGTQDLSARTEQQASSLEETAASMEELTSTVKENASNAQEANQIAETAASVASKGGAEVQAVVDTMAAIDASARKISDIIGTIDGIAFQTNILALNAAVEAARAGEQGRGFAVVASEVRNLAQRSAVAAKEIKQLIADSGEHVALGNKRVASAGATMVQVVDSVRKVTQIMAQITSATSEQSSGIEQVNVAVTQMDQVTQQNAALVEEASAAAEAMQHQAAQLLESVSVFKLNTQSRTPQIARPAAPHREQLALH